MANSITQHPPSALAFPSAARPSALGFGFGTPTRSPLASVNFGQWASPVGFGAGQVGGPSTSASPLKPRPSPYPTSTSRAGSNLKRGRRSSSPPSSPTPSHVPPPRKQSGGLEEVAGNRRMKKLRQDPKAEELSSQVDVGMMLASLPPNAYLQMFLSMLKSDPSLASTILEHMPRPELSSCLLELDRAMERFEKQFGPPGRHPMSWTRSESMVLDFCRLATSYIHFFNSPSPKSPPADLGTLHTLLFSITRHILSLLRIAPSTIDNSEATANVSSLANLVISKWSLWVEALVISVGQAEMYPQSTVAAWAANLDSIAQTSEQGHAAAFARELSPARDRFVKEVGWMMGPRRW